MQYKFIDQKFKYDGTQLKSLFAYMNHGLMGDSMVAWEGECDIPFAHMVDGEDVLAQSEIRGGHMLHFIIEEFGKNLELVVSHQRLFAGLVFEELFETLSVIRKTSSTSDGSVTGKTSSKTATLGSKDDNSFTGLRREGDDIYINDGKLSISIATVSPVSALIHFAVNVTNLNTPVKTACLQDLKISPKTFAERLGQRFTQELRTIHEACCKVRWVY